MKVYRGPQSKSFYDNSHEHVSSISSSQLEKSIKDGTYIQFNINKESNERQSICTVHFEDEDIVPMINGLMSKLKDQQNMLSKINKVVKKEHQDNNEQLIEIKKIVRGIK